MEIRKRKGMRESKRKRRYGDKREKKEGKGQLPCQTLAVRGQAKEIMKFR